MEPLEVRMVKFVKATHKPRSLSIDLSVSRTLLFGVSAALSAGACISAGILIIAHCMSMPGRRQFTTASS